MSEQPQPFNQRVDNDMALLHADRTRRSRIAVIAFWLALIMVIPLAGPIAAKYSGTANIVLISLTAGGVALIAAILGVIGILRTRKRRRRGRVLAIFAVILGVIGIAGQPLVGYTVKIMLDGMTVSSAAIRVLSKPHDELATAATEWCDKYATDDFRTLATPEQFAAWLESTVAQHGQLQSFERTRDFIKRKGINHAFRYTGRFVNGSAIIETAVSFKTGKPLIDNIFVNDSSPRD